MYREERLTIPLDKLEFKWNVRRAHQPDMLKDPAQREKLRSEDAQIVAIYESFAEKGQMNPCIVLRAQRPGYYMMWCGNQRLVAALALGWESLDCVVVDKWEHVVEAASRNYGVSIHWDPDKKHFGRKPDGVFPMFCKDLLYYGDKKAAAMQVWEDGLADPEFRAKHHRSETVGVYYSMRDLGQKNPVILRAGGNRVWAGNQRLAAARALGWEFLQCYRANRMIHNLQDVKNAVYKHNFRWDGKTMTYEE